MRFTATKETSDPCAVSGSIWIIVLIIEAAKVAGEFGGDHVLVKLVGKVLDAGSLHDGVNRPIDRLFVHILVSHRVAS